MKKLRKIMRASPSVKREEGIALVIALLIMIMLTVVGLVAIISSSTETAIANNARGSTQALYLAEAGIAQVSWWFYSPGSFNIAGHFPNGFPGPLDTLTNPTDFFVERRQLNSSYFVDASTTQFTGTYTGAGTDTSDLRLDTRFDADADQLLNTNNNAIFRNLQDLGRITELRVFKPSTTGNICTVRVTAVSRLGGSRTIEQELSPNVIPGLLGPMQSGLGAQWNGNGTVHWGEIWVQGNADLPGNIDHIPYKYKDASLTSNTYDRWFKAKISGTYVGQNAAVAAPYSATCNTNPDGAAYNPVCHDNLLQNQSVTLQKWDYQNMKDYSQLNGYYYVYDGTNVRKGSLTGPVVPVDYLLNTNAGFVFIDTPNQTDPAAGGTSFTLSKSGSSDIKGAVYIAGNLDVGGLGGGNNLTVEAPPNPPCTADASGPCSQYTLPEGERETATLNGVQVRGVLYTTGSMSFNGNPTIFGAVVAEGGFGAGGNPNIYYDWDIRKGRYPGLSPTAKKVWREVRQD